MNNKGQTLVIFLILIPVIVILLALVIDMGLVQSEKVKLFNTTKTIIKNVYDKIETKEDAEIYINELIEKNYLKIDNLKINFQNKKLSISFNKEIISIFGKFIGINNYNLEISLTGYMDNDKLIIEKG